MTAAKHVLLINPTITSRRSARFPFATLNLSPNGPNPDREHGQIVGQRRVGDLWADSQLWADSVGDLLDDE